MPQVTDHHRKLEAFAGRWSGEETIHPSPWDPKGGKARGIINARLDLGGFFLIEDYLQERDGRTAYRGHGVIGWNAADKCYVMHWFDSMGDVGPQPARGTLQGDTLAFQHDNPANRSRYVYRFLGPGRIGFKIENSSDGREWNTFIEAVYVRE
jgi:hypothetical protein